MNSEKSRISLDFIKAFHHSSVSVDHRHFFCTSCGKERFNPLGKTKTVMGTGNIHERLYLD